MAFNFEKIAASAGAQYTPAVAAYLTGFCKTSQEKGIDAELTAKLAQSALSDVVRRAQAEEIAMTPYKQAAYLEGVREQCQAHGLSPKQAELVLARAKADINNLNVAN